MRSSLLYAVRCRVSATTAAAAATRSCQNQCRLYRTAASVSELSPSDTGRLFELPLEQIKELGLGPHFPAVFNRQIDTLQSCVVMARKPLIEIIHLSKCIAPDRPSLRALLWGKFGTGKSLTLLMAVAMAAQQNYVVVHVPCALKLTRNVAEVEMSTWRQGRINDPQRAVALLTYFKRQNTHLWKTLSEWTAERDYSFSRSEVVAAGKPITDVVDLGLSAPYIATDCLGALYRELRRASTAGHIRLFFAIDNSNSLYGKTLVKRADRRFAQVSDLSLVNHMRDMLRKDWTNGLVLLVGDTKELSDARDHVTVQPHTPLELFGDVGFDDINPFVPIECLQYTRDEADTIHAYFKDARWLTTEKGRSDRGRHEMFWLSAANPFNYDRLCAFN